MLPQLATSGRAQMLPAPISPLVGRGREIEAGVALLSQADVRLLTLTGPGGIGKTRLAIQIASGLRDRFEDGVLFIDLATISDPILVGSTMGRCSGSGRPATSHSSSA